jgi:hypothetical protein
MRARGDGPRHILVGHRPAWPLGRDAWTGQAGAARAVQVRLPASGT